MQVLETGRVNGKEDRRKSCGKQKGDRKASMKERAARKDRSRRRRMTK